VIRILAAARPYKRCIVSIGHRDTPGTEDLIDQTGSYRQKRWSELPEVAMLVVTLKIQPCHITIEHGVSFPVRLMEAMALHRIVDHDIA